MIHPISPRRGSFSVQGTDLFNKSVLHLMARYHLSSPWPRILTTFHHLGLQQLYGIQGCSQHQLSRMMKYLWLMNIFSACREPDDETFRRASFQLLPSCHQQPLRSKEDHSLEHIVLKESEARSSHWQLRRSFCTTTPPSQASHEEREQDGKD